MSAPDLDMRDLHRLMDMLQSIDVGLLVVDGDFRVHVWNSFMENHSGKRTASVIGNNLLEVFPDIDARWFRRKAESVLLLRSRAFTTWEQRPYLLRFKNYRPITGSSEFMYQNITFLPLASVDGSVDHLGLIIYDVTDIAVATTALEAANGQLEVLSRTDRLTGLNNRGYWEEQLRQEYRRFRRSGRPSTLIMFDIDHFKRVNDTHGHQAGDEVIRQTAAKLQETVRASDVAGRYGGEEFGVILPDTPLDGAMILAERLRGSIEALPVKHENVTIRYTISIGCAEIGRDVPSPEAWIERADQALYDAKHNGRNRVVAHAA